jgi:signal transduction histidine kinase
VSDNGIGLSSGADSKGRGLATMRARAAALGGAVTVTGPPGGGTTVEFVTARFD